jgi:carboxyl-terminal processing protease
MKKLNTIILVVVLILLVGQAATATGIDERMLPAFLTGSPNSTSYSKDEIAQNMQKLELLYRLVDRDFLFDIDHKEVYESMAKGLFTGLKDEYSAYIVSQEASDFNEDTTGIYAGIGAYISKNYLEYRDFSKPSTYMVNISSVFPGSPAESAGLRSGDLVSHIDGEAVDDWEATDASKALKGQPDTPVVLTVVRGDNTFDVTVIRKIVSVPTVSVDWIEDGIFYLRITQFTTKTAEQVQKELSDALKKGMSALILDFRENPGGIVESTLNIADMFLKDQVIVQVHSKNEHSNRVYTSSAQTLIPTDLPMVTLVNKGSASSSEILSGALKDNKRATLIGSTTFGKGLIQIVSPFGDGFYTVTTSQYLTPNGDDIHKIGISVDIEVNEPHVDVDQMDDYLDFLNSGLIDKFLEENEVFTEEAVRSFIDENIGEEKPLDDDIYRLVLRREFLAKISLEDRPIADPQYDLTLNRALKFLKEGQ